MKPFIVAHAKSQEQTGTAISEHVFPIGQPDGSFNYIQLIGVLWDDHRTPSPSYHAPAELMWLDIPGVLGDDDEEAEEIEDDEAEEESDEEEEEDEDAEYEEEDEGELIEDINHPIQRAI